jgi:DNA-binding PadR family transcriptional regulator
MTNVGSWGGVSVGALYRELRDMEGEGLVEAVRTEQVGRRPARTIYRITDEGHRELHILREKAIVTLRHGPDALGVALLFGMTGEREEFVPLLRARRQALATELQNLSALRTHLEAKGYLSLTLRRAEMIDTAELAWHDELDKILSEPEPAGQQAQDTAEVPPVAPPLPAGKQAAASDKTIRAKRRRRGS